MNLTRCIAAAALAAFVSSAPTVASAQSPGEKLGRGLSGMAFGVLALPGEIVEETRIRGAVGIPIGFAEGLGMAVTRELVGAYEFLTAPFPVPAGYRPILSPPYPWDYFH